MISSCNCSDVVFKMKYQTEIKRHLEEDIPSGSLVSMHANLGRIHAIVILNI